MGPLTGPGRRRRRVGRNQRRDRRLVAAFGALLLASLGVLGWGVAGADQPRPAALDRAVDTGPDGVLDLTFAGDTMLGDGAARLMAAKGVAAPLAGVEDLLAGDVTVLNAEGPVTTSPTPANPGAKYSYAVDPAAAAALASAGVDVLALGNNHAMDRGPVGLRDTVRHAGDAGMSAFGAGDTLARAGRPLLLHSAQGVTALVGLGENFGPLHRATEVTPGMVPLTPAHVEAGVSDARKAGADRVIAVVHWGDNYSSVNAQQRYWAGRLVDAGYDAIIGTGSHTLQSVEVLRGRPVVYGLGNFVFGAPGRFAAYGQQGLGAVAGLRWDRSGRGSLSLRCVRTDNAIIDYVARPCTPPELTLAARGLGPQVRWAGGVGRVDF